MKPKNYNIGQTLFVSVLFFVLAFFNFHDAVAQVPSWTWAKSVGGTGDDEANFVTTDALGNVYVSGYFDTPSITFGSTTLTNLGSTDGFIAKYDASGNVLWANSIASTGPDKALSVAADASGNCYVAGYFNSANITIGDTTMHSAGNEDLFIVKYDASGNVVWVHGAGGAYGDFAFAVTMDKDGSGDILMTGTFPSVTITFGSVVLTNYHTGTGDMFIVKYDPNGSVIWAKNAGNGGNEAPYSVTTDASGNSYLTGTFDATFNITTTSGITTLTNVGGYDVFLVKYDASGNVIWAESGGGSAGDYAYSVVADASNNTYVTGFYFGPSITFGSTTLTTASGTDMYIVKYDASGNVMWAHNAGGIADIAQSVTIDASGNVYVTGYFGSPNITFGSTILTNTSFDTTVDIYLVKYDADGNVIWATSVPGSSQDFVNSITADASNNIYMTGFFYSSDLTFGSTVLTSSGYFDIFLAKLGAPSSCTLSVGASTNPICQTKKTTLTASGATTYAWSPASGLNTTSGAIVTAKPNHTTTYTVTGDGGACTATIKVNVNPAPSVTVNQSPCSGHKVKLVASTNPTTGVTYQWVKNNVVIAGATNKVYYATATASYSCKVTLTSTGCNRNSVAVSVNINCKMGADEVVAFDATAFPNPFEQSLTVNIASGSTESATVTLLDLSGRIIRQYDNIDVTAPFEINENLGAGVYLVNVKQGANEKMIKVVKSD